ncbi:hypothetical protein Tco_1197836 [Tanacetum coccineum]
MDDPNITMEEYIRLEEEKARKRGKVFNWETAKYGKIWYDEDIHDLRSVETEFPAIAFNDEVSSEKTLSCEPTVSSLNDENDFRISFDDSDDEDYTVIFDKNSFSYKKISSNDLKTDSENDNEKVMPSLPSPEPTVSCFDDLDFFNDFENEFLAIVFNDAQMSNSNLLTEPILSPQHIDEFDLNDEISLSEYDEEEQNVLYFNDLFPFNIIHPDDLKSEKDNGDSEIDKIQYLGEQYGYMDADIADFEAKLTRIYRREVHRVQVFDFEGLSDLMAEGLSARMLMEHRDAQGQNCWIRCTIDGAGFDWSDMVEEEIQANMALTAFSDSVVTKSIKWDLSIGPELEKVKEEKEGFEFKIAKFKKSSKDLDQLLASQITDKSKNGIAYNAVPSPHPLILNRPTPLDLSYSGLEEFKQPEVSEYGPRDSSVKPTTGCDKESDNSKENTDDSLKQQQKTDSSSVKSPLKVDKDWKEKFFIHCLPKVNSSLC